MKKIRTLKSKIAKTKAVISRQEKILKHLEYKLEECQSTTLIKTHRITKEKVQLSSGDNIPWHGTIDNYVNWLRKNKVTKKWAEWNGRIYATSDLVKGHMKETHVRLEQL